METGRIRANIQELTGQAILYPPTPILSAALQFDALVESNGGGGSLSDAFFGKAYISPLLKDVAVSAVNLREAANKNIIQMGTFSGAIESVPAAWGCVLL